MNELKLVYIALIMLALIACLSQYQAIRETKITVLPGVNVIDFKTILQNVRNLYLLPRERVSKTGYDENAKRSNQLEDSKKKLIMISLGLYDKEKGKEMKGIPVNYNFTDMDGSPCPVSHCQVTYNRSKLDESDAVYFDGRIIHELDIKQLKELRLRSSEQIWMWVMHENPNFTYYNVSDYDQFFNWSVTFRPSSDIYAPYFGIKKLQSGDYRPSLGKNFAEGKDKKVLVIISHCTKYRMDMIKKLKQFIDVDLYGACKDLINPELPHCHRDTNQCTKLMQRYKFYLAIENFYCNDYVTEKYYKNGLIRHIVPIVLNGGNFSNTKQVFLPKSYINMEEFDSMRSLGTYLNFLDKNDTAYNIYHKWSYHYRIELKNTLCDVCKELWNNDKEKKGKELKLSSFWSKNLLCQSYEEPKFQKYLS